MVKTVSATEAKNHLGALMKEVNDGADIVLIAQHGTPNAAIVSIEKLARFEEFEQEARVARARKSLEMIRSSDDGRNDDLSDDEATDLAVQAVRETRRELRTEGKLRFENDQ